jgi:hypothetical protein
MNIFFCALCVAVSTVGQRRKDRIKSKAFEKASINKVPSSKVNRPLAHLRRTYEKILHTHLLQHHHIPPPPSPRRGTERTKRPHPSQLLKTKKRYKFSRLFGKNAAHSTAACVVGVSHR